MNRFFLLMIFFLLGQNLKAQDLTACQKIVDLTATCISEHSATALEAHLADDFSFNGISNVPMKLVLNQLFIQLGETVTSYELTNQEKDKETLTLTYNFVYKNKGEKASTFVFNANNELKEMSLFKMEVKTMKGEASIKNTAQKVTTVPFEMANNLIIVDVILNGQKKKFILDSGAPKVILNAKYFIEEVPNQTKISTAKGAGGYISDMDIFKIESLDFAGIQMQQEDLLTIDLSHLEEELETEFYGLIGYELIKDYDLLFDYEKKELTFINPDFFPEYRANQWPDKALSAIPFDLDGHIPIIQTKVGDKSLYCGIDSGAESNLLDDDLFPEMKRQVKKITEDELVGADKNVQVVKKAKVKSTFIGGKEFKELDTVFSDISHLNSGYNVALDGILGYEILSKQPTLLSYSRQELIFIE